MCEEDEKIIHRLKYYNDEDHLSKRIVELQHCIEDLRNQLQQKENIIKEARELLNQEWYSVLRKGTIIKVREILDKENQDDKN